MGHSGDGCDLASTLCKYDLRKVHLFVPSSARVQRVRDANVWWRCDQDFVIAFCGEMPRDNRCMYMAHVWLYAFLGCTRACVCVDVMVISSA